MRRWWLIAAVLFLPGGAILGAWWLWGWWKRRRDTTADDSNPLDDAVATAEKATGAKVAQVHSRHRADGIDPRLQAALDAWELEGPFDISVGSDGGVRTAARQFELYLLGRDPRTLKVVAPELVVTNARGVADGPHPRGGAVDLWPRFDGTPHPDNKTPEENAAWDKLVAFMEARGLVSGSRFRSPVDWPHFELPDWRDLPPPLSTQAGPGVA